MIASFYKVQTIYMLGFSAQRISSTYIPTALCGGLKGAWQDIFLFTVNGTYHTNTEEVPF
jgi:hypothetical protein